MYQGNLPPVSNRQSYEQSFQVKDSETDDLIDLTDAVIVYEICKVKCGSPVLSASTANSKITIASLGVFTVAFTTSEMRQLCDKEYDVGCTISSDGDTENNTEQFLICRLSVLDGVVA